VACCSLQPRYLPLYIQHSLFLQASLGSTASLPQLQIVCEGCSANFAPVLLHVYQAAKAGHSPSTKSTCHSNFSTVCFGLLVAWSKAGDRLAQFWIHYNVFDHGQATSPGKPNPVEIPGFGVPLSCTSQACSAVQPLAAACVHASMSTEQDLLSALHAGHLGCHRVFTCTLKGPLPCQCKGSVVIA